MNNLVNEFDVIIVELQKYIDRRAFQVRYFDCSFELQKYIDRRAFQVRYFDSSSVFGSNPKISTAKC
ncbi:hypothetical protein PPL_08178 [Heterostelium album PN500]|uniref:Uncharacterized protein n=1 Tax=Heterostelium pallidum (strain ATCC 26659 / Pp 5 / PN500) TaxID=670386 RepID=D3BIU3_HETP5|nr:hypothetical protein PPL_08178 [Heterostelium album PN500]EFA78717.1 hypothetical protein PPL_08178 [Heterostelium album PN500]|eukprot:XP_020430841.1 hypothetical protein PPL_08178 [Heterostelium album PN500]